MNAKEVLREAKRLGWTEKSQKGSYIKLENTCGKTVIIPYHGSKDIPKGTLHTILKDIGVKQV